MNLDGVNIVSVDDNELNNEIIKLMLNESALVTFNNGYDLLNYLSECLPDLILLDIMMPEFNGIQVLEKIRSNPKTKSIPVIMVTSMDEKEIKDELAMAGFNNLADGYVTKPFKMKKLKNKIVEILKNNSH